MFKNEFQNNWINQGYEFQVDITDDNKIRSVARPGSFKSINEMTDVDNLDTWGVIWGQINNKKELFSLSSYINNLYNSPQIMHGFEHVLYIEHSCKDDNFYYEIKNNMGIFTISKQMLSKNSENNEWQFHDIRNILKVEKPECLIWNAKITHIY